MACHTTGQLNTWTEPVLGVEVASANTVYLGRYGPEAAGRAVDKVGMTSYNQVSRRVNFSVPRLPRKPAEVVHDLALLTVWKACMTSHAGLLWGRSLVT